MTRPDLGRPAAAAGSLLGAAALITALTVVSRITGFGRVVVFQPSVGTGCLGTAYTSANQLPNVLFEVVAGGALAGAVVPLIAGPLAQGRRADADRIASALLGWAVVVLLPLSVLLAVLAGPLSRLIAAGGCSGGTAAAARMLVVFAPQVVLYGVGVVLTGVLQAHHRFAAPALAPVLSSLMVIGSYLLFAALAGSAREAADWLPGRGLELLLAGGTTLGVVALSLPLLVPLHRAGTRLRPTLRFPPGVAARARALAVAGIGALIAQQCAVVATLVLANRVGGQSAFPVLQFVQAVYLLPFAVLAVPLATAAFPRLAEHHAQGDGERYSAVAASSTRLVLLVSWLGAGSLIAVAPAVQVLFRSIDVANGTAGSAVAAGLTGFAPGLVGWGLVAHAGRALYAAERGRDAALATAAGWAASVAASVVAVLVLHARSATAGSVLLGIGIGNSVGMTLAGLLLLLAVRRAAGGAALDGVARALLAGGAGAGLAALAGRRLGAAFDATSAVSAVLTGSLVALVAAAVFVAAVAVLDRRDLVLVVRR